MFRKDRISVLEWIILLLILATPILNIVFGVLIFIRGRSSQTVRNFFIAGLILYVLASAFGLFTGTFNNLQGLFN